MFFLVALIVAGVALAIRGITQLDRAGAMAKWPSVEGEIYSSRVEETMEIRAEVPSGRVYQTDIHYSYLLEGTEYTSSQRSDAATPSTRRASAEVAVSRYPVGRRVTVYYNPKNPRDSVLDRATVRSRAVLLTAAGSIVAIGAAVWAWLR